jgi:iron complex outermembrane receptor protein
MSRATISNFIILLLTSAGVAAIAPGASAQSATAQTAPLSGRDVRAARSGQVEEVVVTANKRAENLIDVAQSVSVVTGAALDLQQAVHFEDYVTRIPGYNLVSAQAGESRLVIDGINTGGVSSTIGTYVDETPFGSVTGLANGAVLAPDLDTFDVARIEVLRGPQGTLYGASSLGGLLKIVTNAPELGHFSGKIEVGGEDTSGGSTSGSVKGLINVPIGDTFAIRASGFYSEQSGFINDPLRGARHVNDNKFNGGRLGLLWQPTAKLTLRATAIIQDILSSGASVEDVDPTTLQPLYGDLTQSRTFSAPSDVAYRVYNLTGTYDLGFASLLSSTSYGMLRQKTNEDATAEYGDLLTGALGEPLGAAVLQNLDQNKFTEELRLTSAPGKFEWIVGGFFTREQNALLQNLSALSLPSTAIAPGLDGLEVLDLRSAYNEYAGFANADYHFTDRFDISAGGRYSHNDQSAAQTTSGLLVGPTTLVGGTSSDNVFTFAVAPKFKITDDSTLYARIAKGYRPGGPNAISPLSPAAVPRTFAADTLIDYQLGFKAQTPDRRASIDVSAFYIDWSNIQLLADIDNTGVNTNGAGARSDGIEGTVTFVPIRGLDLSGNAAYTDAVLTADTPAIVGGHNGDRLPYSAHFTGAANADYSIPLQGDSALFMGGSLRYVGSRYGDFDGVHPSGNHIALPSYVSLDLRAGVTYKTYRLEAYVKNVNDERGILSIGGVGATPNGAAQAGIERPRTFGLLLAASY